MFFLTQPQVQSTEVFTRMPERFRRPQVQTDWARANRGGQPTDSFLEGPVFDDAGHLYVSDIPHGLSLIHISLRLPGAVGSPVTPIATV